MQDRRSHSFLKKFWAFELRRPAFWLLSVSLLIQILRESVPTMFGAEHAGLFDFEKLGFSPEQPWRMGLLPWFFSWSIHISWEHFFGNALGIGFLAFWGRPYLKSRDLWWRVLLIQIFFNWTLWGARLILNQVRDDVIEPSLYLGLSSIAYGVLGSLAKEKNRLLRTIAVVAVGLEFYKIATAGEFSLPLFAHLMAFLIGLFTVHLKRFWVFFVRPSNSPPYQ